MNRDELMHEMESWGTRVFAWCRTCAEAIPLRNSADHWALHGRATADEVERWIREGGVA